MPQVPAQKTILGTNIVVDAFSWGPLPGVRYYCLTHFHADHYGGLRAPWDWGGLLVASEVTAALVERQLGVARDRILSLPLDGRWRVLDGGGEDGGGQVEILLVDANQYVQRDEN